MHPQAGLRGSCPAAGNSPRHDPAPPERAVRDRRTAGERQIAAGPASGVAVTGASGAVGSRFVEEARAAGIELKLFSGSPHAPRADGLEFRPLPIDSESAIDPAEFRGCGTLLHLVARIPPRHDDVEEARRCWEVNALGTLRLLRAAAEAGVTRFVHTTSANAYAPWVARPDETAPLFPASREYYLGSKIAQELYAQAFCREAGISVAVLRLGSVYGPHPNTASRIAERLLRGEKVELFAEGRFGADFVSVDDIAKGIALVLHSGAEGTFNLGSGVRTTIAELTGYLRELTGAPGELIESLPASGQEDRGFPPLDIGRARALGYEPISLSEGLARMVQALRPAR